MATLISFARHDGEFRVVITSAEGKQHVIASAKRAAIHANKGAEISHVS